MTELMKQLQQWANEGRYDWEKGTFNVEGLPFPKLASCYQNPHENRPEYIIDIMQSIKLVLDGIIQVWRPVEHYKPKNIENVLLFDPTHTDEIGDPLITVIGYYREEDGEFHRFEIYRNGMTLMSPTHWQPLPQPPQKGGE